MEVGPQGGGGATQQLSLMHRWRCPLMRSSLLLSQLCSAGAHLSSHPSPPITLGCLSIIDLIGNASSALPEPTSAPSA